MVNKSFVCDANKLPKWGKKGLIRILCGGYKEISLEMRNSPVKI